MATQNQKQLARNILPKVRKGEKISISKEMLKVGYSKNTSKQPGKVTKSDGWAELMDKYLPDKDLAKVHKQLLKHKDWRAKDAGLDKGYKVKGKYAPEKVEVTEKVEVDEKELKKYKQWRKQQKN